MPDFYTDAQGRTRPITPKKGTGGVVVTAVLTGVLAAAGGADATTSVGAALDSTQSQIRAETNSARDAAESGDETEAWRRLGLKELKLAVKQHLQCAVQSYSQVREFFLQHGCTSLDGKLIPLGDLHGTVIVVSVAWVRMSSDSDAAALNQLEDTYGTGDITPLPAELLQLRDIRFTAQHYKSRRHGSLVVVAEAEPVEGRPSTQVLNGVADVAASLPTF